MATSLVKTITIRDEVYKKLLTVKKKDESFSELFERLAENRDQTEILKKLRATWSLRIKARCSPRYILFGLKKMISLDTDVLIEILDRKSKKATKLSQRFFKAGNKCSQPQLTYTKFFTVYTSLVNP